MGLKITSQKIFSAKNLVNKIFGQKNEKPKMILGPKMKVKKQKIKAEKFTQTVRVPKNLVQEKF